MTRQKFLVRRDHFLGPRISGGYTRVLRLSTVCVKTVMFDKNLLWACSKRIYSQHTIESRLYDVISTVGKGHWIIENVRSFSCQPIKMWKDLKELLWNVFLFYSTWLKFLIHRHRKRSVNSFGERSVPSFVQSIANGTENIRKASTVEDSW